MLPDAVNANCVKIFENRIKQRRPPFSMRSRLLHCLSRSDNNDNIPAVTVVQDTAHTSLSALKQIRDEKQSKIPKIVVLSSSSPGAKPCDNLPVVFHHWFVVHANWNVHGGLRVQERMLRTQQDWLSSILIKLGGLVVDKQRACTEPRAAGHLPFLPNTFTSNINYHCILCSKGLYLLIG